MMTAVVLLLFVAPLLISCEAGEPMDCNDISRWHPDSESGVYTIYPSELQSGIQVYCHMEDGGWTVIQRRMDGTVNFYRPWYQYVNGFGSLDGEYWLGLENMNKLTFKPRELLVEMENFDGHKVSARYSSFSVGAQCDGYKLTVSGFSNGGAGDSLTYHNNMKFSTFDKDQDRTSGNCAKSYFGGWWYNNCCYSNPNALYHWGLQTGAASSIYWRTWNKFNYSLKSFTMKIK